MKQMLAFASAAVMALLTTAAAAVPAHFTYTGELWAENGMPYTGTVQVGVSIYGGMSGGSALWTQAPSAQMVNGGALEVDLAANELLALFAAHSNLWLEFTVDGETLEPRQQLTSVPFAAQAANAQTLGGMPASAFMAAGSTLPSSSLPTNGIGPVSNWALNNSFANVDWDWTGNVLALIDAPSQGVSANVTTTETGNSYLTDLTVYTSFSLIFPNQVRLRLFPPQSSGLSPIVLFQGLRGAGVFTEAWTAGTTPELGALLGQKVEGQWTLELTDLDDNAASGTQVGTLSAFSISYDVVRSNHLVVGGRLDVNGPLNVTGKITAGGGIETLSGKLAVAGEIEATGPVVGKFIGLYAYCNSHGPKTTEARYCLDNIQLNTAQGYISVNPNGVINILKAGIYKIEISSMVIVATGWAALDLRRNGTAFARGYGDGQPGWENVQASGIIQLNVGDTIEGYGTNSNNAGQPYTWHSGNYGGIRLQYLGM